jgi:hypothetical protein
VEEVKRSEKFAPSFSVTIFMAGDIETARAVLRQECFRAGLCVTLEACEYIYTGGAEQGFRVGLINYPRFPKTPQELVERAHIIADELRVKCCQWSYTIQGPGGSVYVTYRPEVSLA